MNQCGYSLDLVCSFDSKEDKQTGNDCIKKFCSELKELETKVVNYEQKEMTPLTDDENWYHEEQKQCYICRNHFVIIKNKKKRFKLYKKVRGIILSFTGKFRGAAHSICNLH